MKRLLDQGNATVQNKTAARLATLARDSGPRIYATLYLSLAAIFVAQAAGVHMSWERQVIMLLTLMLTSKGVAGVPRASLVILLGTLASFNLPAEGVLVILGVDELMDMARTAVNVIGNCLATVVIARWEGAFRSKEWIGEEAELEEVTGQPAIVS